MARGLFSFNESDMKPKHAKTGALINLRPGTVVTSRSGYKWTCGEYCEAVKTRRGTWRFTLPV